MPAAADTSIHLPVYDGDEMILMWLCRDCGHEWPITRKEPHSVPDADR